MKARQEPFLPGFSFITGLRQYYNRQAGIIIAGFFVQSLLNSCEFVAKKIGEKPTAFLLFCILVFHHVVVESSFCFPISLYSENYSAASSSATTSKGTSTVISL